MEQEAFTSRMWQAAAPVYDRIVQHPFIIGLADGTLERGRFAYYLAQDIKYISGFVSVMSGIAARAPTRQDVAMLSRRAGELAAEHELHEGLARDLGLDPDEIASTPTAPTCLAYLNFLRSESQLASFLEALAAMLACPWVYWEVGKHLVSAGSPDPLYQRWIDRYGGEVAALNVPPLLELAERCAATATDAQVARAIDNFVTGCRYEWMFWEMGYAGERWPV